MYIYQRKFSSKTSEVRTNVQAQSFHHVIKWAADKSNSVEASEIMGENTLGRQTLSCFG